MTLLLGACADPKTLHALSENADTSGVVGGTEVPAAGDSLSPYLAFIYGEKDTGESYVCSGAFLTPQVVVTAAHCVVPDISTMMVFKGSQPLRNSSAYLEVRAVKIHENYQENGKDDRNDVALVFLSSAAQSVQLIHLDDSTTMPDEKLFAYGYGRTDGIEGSTQASSDLGVLRHITLEAHRLSAYNEKLLEYDQSHGQGLCFGDSGGPLLTAEGRLVGIAAAIEAGDGDDQCRYRAYFSRVVSYRDWIISNLNL